MPINKIQQINRDTVMEKNAKIFVAGYSGLVGSALVRQLKLQGYTNLLLADINNLDMTDIKALNEFFPNRTINSAV